MEPDDVLKSIGTCSRYQMMIYFLISFVCMRGVWHIIAIDFIGGPVGHQCAIPADVPLTVVAMNKSEAERLQCDMYTDSFMNVTEKCSEWIYASTNVSYTITQQWDLVCNVNYLSELSSTIFMVGTMSGAVFISPLSDRFGRKPVMLACIWLQAVLGVVIIFPDSYIVFTVLRFFMGACNQAIGLVGYLLVTEVFPASSRTLPSIAIYLWWGVGIMVLALLAYLLPYWKHLELAISIPSFITLVYYWILPESIPWLIAKEKFSKVHRILKFASTINGKSTTFDETVFASSDKSQPKEKPRGFASDAGRGNNIDLLSVKYVQECSERDNGFLKPVTDEGLPRSKEVNGHRESRTKVTSDSTFQDETKADLEHPNSTSLKKKYTVLDLFKTRRMFTYTVVMFYLWLVNSLVYFGIMFAIPTFHGNVFLNMFLSGLVEIPAYIICMTVLQIFGRRRPLFLFMMLCGVSSLAYVFTPLYASSGYNLTWVKITLAMISKFAITGSYATIYLYAAEIYPTVIRNQGLGMSSFFENIGGIASPFIAYSAKSIPWLPMAISGCLTVVGGVVALLLPETHRRPLPETIEDVENFKTII